MAAVTSEEQAVGEIVPMEQAQQEWAVEDQAARTEAFLAHCRATLEAASDGNFLLVRLPPSVDAAQLNRHIQVLAANPGVPMLHLAMNIAPALLAKFAHNERNPAFVQGALNAALDGLVHYLRRTPGGGIVLPNGGAGPLRIAPMPGREH